MILVTKSVDVALFLTCKVIRNEAMVLLAPMLDKVKGEPLRFIIDTSSLFSFAGHPGILDMAIREHRKLLLPPTTHGSRVAGGADLPGGYGNPGNLTTEPLYLGKHLIMPGVPEHALVSNWVNKCAARLAAPHISSSPIGRKHYIVTICPHPAGAGDNFPTQIILWASLPGLSRFSLPSGGTFSVLIHPGHRHPRWNAYHTQMQAAGLSITERYTTVNRPSLAEWVEEWEEKESF